MGFKALATTSAGYAFSRGQRDNAVSRAETMAHLRELASATHLPVSADLGDCFGGDSASIAETIRLAAEAGVVGCSIEDSTSGQADPIYPFEAAVERVRAAADAAQALSFPFMLTARSENYAVGRADIKDTIRRLQAYREAGADVVFAHGIKSREEIAAVVEAVDCPVNVLISSKGMGLDLAELSRLGVKRVSVGPSLFTAAMSAVLRAGQELQKQGAFTYIEDAENLRDLFPALIRT